MRQTTRSAHEAGQALTETILLALILLVPFIWGLGVLSELHKAALATSAAAREAGFDAARTWHPAEADDAIDRAVARALVDEGLDPALARVRWSTGSSLARGAPVEVEVSYPVTVVQAPLLGRVSGPSIWMKARHAARTDPYRSRE